MNPVQALNVARLHLAVLKLGGRVLCVNIAAHAAHALGACTFSGWALTEGQHRPKAGKKKKTREAGLFFLVPTSLDASSGSGLTQRHPTLWGESIYLSSISAQK